MRDVTVGQVAEALVTVNFFYEEGDAGKFPPIVRDVEVRNVTSKKSQYVLLLRGYARDPVSDVRVVDCTFDNVEKADVLESVKDIVYANVKVNGTARNERITQVVREPANDDDSCVPKMRRGDSCAARCLSSHCSPWPPRRCCPPRPAPRSR